MKKLFGRLAASLLALALIAAAFSRRHQQGPPVPAS